MWQGHTDTGVILTSRTSSTQPTGSFTFSATLSFQGWLSGLEKGVSVGILGCTHDAVQPWLNQVAALIQGQTGVEPTRFLQPGGPFAYFTLNDRLRQEVQPWLLGTHDDIAETLHAALQLDGGNAGTNHYLVVADGPMCLCGFLKRRPDPAAEARTFSIDILPAVAQRIADEADAHRRPSVVTTVRVMPGSADSFASETSYQSQLVRALG